MTKIIISILSVLLILFPFSGTLQAAYQNLSFPGRDDIVSTVCEAIRNDDAEAIEELYSKEKRESVDDLNEKLQEMLNLIDGEIVKTELWLGLDNSTDYNNYGSSFSEKGWTIRIETTLATYRLDVYWIAVDTTNPDNVGLKGLTLGKYLGPDKLIENLMKVK